MDHCLTFIRDRIRIGDKLQDVSVFEFCMYTMLAHENEVAFEINESRILCLGMSHAAPYVDVDALSIRGPILFPRRADNLVGIFTYIITIETRIAH